MAVACDHPSEGRFTYAHPGCRKPWLWHAPDKDSTECEVSELVGALCRALQPEAVVETGSAYGFTTAAIASALAANGHGHLVSLEVDHDLAVVARERLCDLGLSDWGEVAEVSSLSYEPPGPLGFCWFDSLYELREPEFRRYRDLGALQPGTVVGFHDTTSGLRGHYFDMAEAVARLEAEGLLRAIYLPTPRGVALASVVG